MQSSASVTPRPAASRPARAIPAHTLFFPAAALYGAAAIAVSVPGLTGITHAPNSLSVPFGHAHEMLLGYALAVLAGYQLPGLPASRLSMLFALWLLGRLCFVALGGGAVSGVLNAAFAIALAVHAAPRLARSAKKWRNLALPALLVSICAAAFAYVAIRWVAGAVASSVLHTAMILLLAALMLFMGGRMLAAMAAGEFYRQGRSLDARVQPRIEAALLVTTAVATIAALFPALDVAMRIACVAAGLLAAVRIARWRLWTCARRPDILRLAIGYAWLAVGLIAIGGVQDGALRTAALHLVTIGALGTLSFNVMAKVALAGSVRDVQQMPWLTAGTLSIGVAALLRFASVLWPPDARALLVAAAACWTAAFVGLFVLLVRATAARRRDRARPAP